MPAASSGLGRTQILVLQLLAIDEKSVATMARDGFGLSESSVYSAVMSLGTRGLVDRRSSYGTIVYYLTPKGAEVEQALLEDDED